MIEFEPIEVQAEVDPPDPSERYMIEYISKGSGNATDAEIVRNNILDPSLIKEFCQKYSGAFISDIIYLLVQCVCLSVDGYILFSTSIPKV
jgi:hypothetical protein